MTKDDLEIFASDLFPYENVTDVTAIAVVRKLYQQNEDRLTKIFRDHYRFKTDEFRAEFMDRGSRKMSLRRDEAPAILKKRVTRQSLLRKHLIGHSVEMELSMHIEAAKIEEQTSAESVWSQHLSLSSSRGNAASGSQSSSRPQAASHENVASGSPSSENEPTHTIGSETRNINGLTEVLANQLGEMEWEQSTDL